MKFLAIILAILIFHQPLLFAKVTPPDMMVEIEKEVLALLITDSEHDAAVMAADLTELKDKRELLPNGNYLLYFKVHDLYYKVEIEPKSGVLSMELLKKETGSLLTKILIIFVLGFISGFSVRK
jgi:hypothetical protein